MQIDSSGDSSALCSLRPHVQRGSITTYLLLDLIIVLAPHSDDVEDLEHVLTQLCCQLRAMRSPHGLNSVLADGAQIA